MVEEAAKDREIRIAVGFRLYQMFCPDCSSELYSEDGNFSKLECSGCHKVFAYRLEPELEEAIIERSISGESLQ